MELEPSTNTTPEPPDTRPAMPEPPPVRLVSVDDVRLIAPTGIETDLDSFYVTLLGFEREDLVVTRPRSHIWMGLLRQAQDRPKVSLDETERSREEPPGPVYRAENFRLRFKTVDAPVVRDGCRVQGIEVRSLTKAEALLTQAETEYTRQRSLVPGRESLILQDPAGNWIELTESPATG